MGLPMGVFGAGYDVNTFSFIKCSFNPGFLSLKERERKKKDEYKFSIFFTTMQSHNTLVYHKWIPNCISSNKLFSEPGDWINIIMLRSKGNCQAGKSVSNEIIGMFIMASKGQKHKAIYRENETEGTDITFIILHEKQDSKVRGNTSSSVSGFHG